MKTSNTIFTKACMVLAATALVNVGCTDDFLKQDPLSFYNPENTYTTESGLQSALAMCDYGLKEMLMDGNGNVMPMASLYFMTDIGLYGKTDAGDMQDDFANKITPTSGMKGGGDENAMSRFWDRTWNSVTFANTIISNVGKRWVGGIAGYGNVGGSFGPAIVACVNTGVVSGNRQVAGIFGWLPSFR